MKMSISRKAGRKYFAFSMHNHVRARAEFYCKVSISLVQVADFNSYRYMCMLRNVICCFALKVFGALKLISWKYTFKRLNEEYEIAKKKQQALDNLYSSGRISQSTRDSFNIEISAAIVAIEKQQKELVAGMQSKTQDLENQLKTLETLLASYEIQHVAGEIDEDIYQREISLLSTGLGNNQERVNHDKTGHKSAFISNNASRPRASCPRDFGGCSARNRRTSPRPPHC